MISIIVPVHNAEKYIEKCVNSILNQTFINFEIILINDGSTDNSKLICENLLNNNRRIVLINQENKGVSAARNIGLKTAKYPYITFVDADDWIKTTYLEVLYNTLIKHKADISICDYIIEDNTNNNKTKKTDQNNITEYCKNSALSHLFIDKKLQNYPWAKLYKASLFNNITYPENTFYEDIFTTFKLFDKCTKIVKIDKTLLHYVKHETNITTSISPQKNMDLLNGLLAQLNFIKKKENRFKNISTIKLCFTKKLYSLKKTLILNYDIDSDIFLKQEYLINQAMVDINILNGKLLFKKKYNLAIYYPKIFLYYLKLSGEKKSKHYKI